MRILRRQPGASLGLTSTLALAFVGISVTLLVMSSLLQIFSNARAQQSIVAHEQRLIAQGAARTVHEFVQQKLSVLTTTNDLIDIASMSSETQQAILESLLGPQPAFRQLAILNADGREVAHSARISQVAARRFAQQFSVGMLAQAQQGQQYISPIYIDTNTSEPLLLMAVPILDGLGDYQGVLVAEVNLKFMWNLVDQIKVGQTGSVYVVDRQGKLIAFSDTARVLRGENLSSLQTVHSFVHRATNESTTDVPMYTGITGTTVLGTYSALGTPDWAVVTELPWEEAYQSITHDIVVASGITIAVAILAGLLGVFVARRLSKPLISLTQTATRITNGELGIQAKIAGPREIASLSAAFNGMTTQLRQTLDSLEQRVADRTVDLRQALDEVEARARIQEALLAENQQQRETIREMSVPVLPVSDSVLVMPLIGAMDTQRLRQLQEQALRAIERSAARTIIIDITGVLIVDSQVAGGLLTVVHAARLLGAEVVLVGIRPEVAQAIVGLGINISDVRTYTDLRSALNRN